ncbi:MAG: glycosyltransferase [Gammaproteobacteria bacterium]|nr:glycosyltransferase [Gammaproteobacteria bacterium]
MQTVSSMHVGHINLATTFNGAGEHFVNLVKELCQHNIEQYVVVRNVALAKRLDIVDGVTVGPVVRSAITAFCLMPGVDVVHVHDSSSASAGLLMALTRSVPFVLSDHDISGAKKNPIRQAVEKRASGFVETDTMSGIELIKSYRQAVDSLRVPTLML